MTCMGRKVSVRTTTAGASMRAGSGTSRILVGLTVLLRSFGLSSHLLSYIYSSCAVSK